MNKIDKELEELSFIIRDGFYKGCKVYHESVKSFLEETIKETEDNYKKELIKEKNKGKIGSGYVLYPLRKS